MSPPFALPVLSLGLALAPAPTVDGRVDALFARWDEEGSPGAAVAVLKDGEVVLADGYGYAQLAHDAPITPETVFHVASISKQVTCIPNSGGCGWATCSRPGLRTICFTSSR